MLVKFGILVVTGDSVVSGCRIPYKLSEILVFALTGCQTVIISKLLI